MSATSPGRQSTVQEAGRVFTDPRTHTDEAYFHRACALLHRVAPIGLVAGRFICGRCSRVVRPLA